jgi:hypothetical protein
MESTLDRSADHPPYKGNDAREAHSAAGSRQPSTDAPAWRALIAAVGDLMRTAATTAGT